MKNRTIHATVYCPVLIEILWFVIFLIFFFFLFQLPDRFSCCGEQTAQVNLKSKPVKNHRLSKYTMYRLSAVCLRVGNTCHRRILVYSLELQYILNYIDHRF